MYTPAFPMRAEPTADPGSQCRDYKHATSPRVNHVVILWLGRGYRRQTVGLSRKRRCGLRSGERSYGVTPTILGPKMLHSVARWGWSFGTHNSLPPGSISWGVSVTWAARILPYLEETAAYDLVDYSELYFTGTHDRLMRIRFPVYTCPSDEPKSRPSGWTKHNYVVNYGNTGFIEPVFDGAAERYAGEIYGGAPFTRSGSYPNHGWPDIEPQIFSFKTILDGTSSTLMLSEAVQGATPLRGGQIDLRGFIWWGNASGFSTHLPPNSAQPDVYQEVVWCDYLGTIPSNPPCIGPHTQSQPMTNAARSRHPGGVYVAMCDGSVDFVDDNVSLRLWRALSTSRGEEVISGDTASGGINGG